MDINYHYYTIKTLAHFAGFADEASEIIAHFSQFIDDFTLSSPFVVEKAPPKFFLDNQLAFPYGNKWVVVPCTTGINALSVLPYFQEYTMLPFHFISPDCSASRCKCADKTSFINQQVEEIIKNTKVDNKDDLIRLGMILHSYADTYAHHNFSAFFSEENKTKILKMDPLGFFERFRFPSQVLFYQSLPPIGHGNAGHAPDLCHCTIKLEMKDGLIERNNADYFAICSKHIYSWLCFLNNRSDEGFEKIQERIKKVHSNKISWKKEFKEVKYRYNKKDYAVWKFKRVVTSLSFKIDGKEQLDTDVADELALHQAKFVSEDFYKFNEFAYRYVYSVLGSYLSDFTRKYIKMIKEEQYG